MVLSKNRREFLKITAGGLAGLGLCRGAFAQSATGQFNALKLADNYTLLTGAGSNVLVLNGPEGVLMVDGGLEEHSADLLKAVTGTSPQGRIQALFNTHWHLEHTGSNDLIGKAGAKIISHENTKLWMGTDIVSMWQHRTYPPRPKEARPNSTFYTTAKMTFGKKKSATDILVRRIPTATFTSSFPARIS
jgi:glyoxylase-like metal-dependent hydrolase (beta-lactamase superfamily II)